MYGYGYVVQIKYSPKGPVKTLLWTNFIICKKVFMFSSGIVQNDPEKDVYFITNYKL